MDLKELISQHISGEINGLLSEEAQLSIHAPFQYYDEQFLDQESDDLLRYL